MGEEKSNKAVEQNEGETFDLYQFNPALNKNRRAGTVFEPPRFFSRRYSDVELDIDAAAAKAEKILRKRGCAFDKIND